jgi:hypothetical protein
MNVTMLKLFMTQASSAEQLRLAELAGTTRGMLYQVSSGFRSFGPVKAAAIERASAVLTKENPQLPRLYRTDLADACASCDFAQKCLGPAAVRAEFPIVVDEGKAR